MKNVTSRDTVPCAYITRGKQRVKQYNQSVYLNNKEEFEIELFNPLTNKVLAEIELNGVSLGAGIVLRPGERVFLERYLNTAKKFLFETYTVDGNNSDVQRAIVNNGNVCVKFYNELKYVHYNTTFDWNTITSQYPYEDATKTFMTSAFVSPDMCSMELTKTVCKDSFETGRIEKGSNSNQKFDYDNSTFETYSSYKSEWKILPISQKPITSEEINVVWCTNCGRQRKKESFKFCPNCGTKFE